jgi:small subunit ribosomal protein S17
MKDQITRQETGIVVSSSRDKTITVLIERKVKHSLYKKILRRSTKLQAHDESNECQDGDLVRIKECRPISKTKSWTLLNIEKKNRNIDL